MNLTVQDGELYRDRDGYVWYVMNDGGLMVNPDRGRHGPNYVNDTYGPFHQLTPVLSGWGRVNIGNNLDPKDAEESKAEALADWEIELLTQNDPVNHPSHYTSHPSGIECIQISRHENFNRGNALKYWWRAGGKQYPGKTLTESAIIDYEKAIFYIQQEVERLETSSGSK